VETIKKLLLQLNFAMIYSVKVRFFPFQTSRGELGSIFFV